MDFFDDLINLNFDLDPTTALTLAAGSFAVWYITTAFISWYRYRHLPGPFVAKFSYIWQVYTIATGRVKENYINLREYGPLVLTAPGTVVTSDPEIFRRANGARSKYDRSPWYAAGKFKHDTTNMGTLIDTPEHDAIKSKTAGPYAGREAEGGLESVVDAQLVRLVDLIKRKYVSRNGELVQTDFSKISRFFTLDVISKLLFGTPWGHLDEGIDVLGWCVAMDDRLVLMFLMMELPALRNLFGGSYGLLRWFGPQPGDKSGLGVVMGYVNKLIREHFTDKNLKQKDMMSGFIRNGLSEMECQGEALLVILAGSDTSAGTIRSTILYLMSNPQAYGRFKREIKEALQQGKVSSPITNEEALKLPYLQAIITEASRIGTPLTFGHYKVVPKGGDTVNGMYLPEGTEIGHNALSLTHNKEIFGEDADIFRPERFLEADPERKAHMLKALDMLFGSGRWTCAGKNLALMELNKIFFELLRHFDFQIVNVQNPVKERAYLTKLHEDMFVRITETDWSTI
ncbi:Putative cytochrome P450 E-class, group I [Podospora comata]|uniref:Cytochrome P450 E-class, group I n=1 Tax=Podospora comata TaxID=48703 RepID=A0ABY6SH87_PODCO|nr:Putative cytochrome P450 E-class, group I [Podospora comata]